MKRMSKWVIAGRSVEAVAKATSFDPRVGQGESRAGAWRLNPRPKIKTEHGLRVARYRGSVRAFGIRRTVIICILAKPEDLPTADLIVA